MPACGASSRTCPRCALAAGPTAPRTGWDARAGRQPWRRRRCEASAPSGRLRGAAQKTLADSLASQAMSTARRRVERGLHRQGRLQPRHIQTILFLLHHYCYSFASGGPTQVLPPVKLARSAAHARTRSGNARKECSCSSASLFCTREVANSSASLTGLYVSLCLKLVGWEERRSRASHLQRRSASPQRVYEEISLARHRRLTRGLPRDSGPTEALQVFHLPLLQQREERGGENELRIGNGKGETVIILAGGTSYRAD